MIAGVKEKEFTAYDGARIHYQDIGSGKPIVLANGLGGSYEAWEYIIRHLAADYRLLSWDYRGLFKSGPCDLKRLTVADHVEDLLEILKREKINDALLMGWSMGTQVIYEFAVRHPEKVNGLVPICGAAGRPFDTALGLKSSRLTMPMLFSAMKRLHGPVGGFMRFAMGNIPNAFEILSASRIFWKGGSEVIRGMVDEYVQLDFETYAQIMLEIGRHDARPFIDKIKTPVMQIAATGDFFTPIAVSKMTHEMLRDSRLEILEGATHYAPLEKPDEINALIDDFIAKNIRWRDKSAPRAAQKKKAKKSSGGKRRTKKNAR